MFDGSNKDIILMGDFNADAIAPERSNLLGNPHE